MLRVHVLGELVVESSGRPVELTGSWRARSLLAWLALNPGNHPRGDLAARFWPEVLDSSARASLRNGLWALRKALGDEDAEALVATRDRVGLKGEPDVWVDAAAFEEHFAHGHLDEALALCRGEVLAGLEDDWVYEFRDEHRLRLSELLEAMAARAEPMDLSRAITLTRQRVALDPLAEDAQRALIERLGRSGDRGGALVAYSRLRDKLRKELGISASAETRRLVERIREGAPAQEAADVPPPPVVAPPAAEPAAGEWAPGLPFPLPPRLRRRGQCDLVGRGAELDELLRAWSEAQESGARLALVTGEAGIGKSRLTQELAARAGEDGAVVLHGSANEDLLMPHQHFVEALGHFLAVASPAELERRIQPRAADLAPVAPSLDAGSEREAREDGAPESRRYRLFEAVAGLLDELAQEAPVLLVIDDLHWADRSTAVLLQHLLESRPTARLLVVAAQRPGEGAAADAHAEMIQRLSQGHFVERVALTGLTGEHIAALSEEVSGRELGPEVVHAISEETAGNPLFVQEVVRHLEDSSGEVSALSLAREQVPDRVREVVNLRLGRLSDPCVRLLTVASVIGTEFPLDPLEQVSDLQGEDLATALDEALAADILLEVEEADQESFSFSHALVRRTLLERLTRAHRRRIHARLADVLESSRGDGALLEIAHHLCEARPVSDREHALEYATRAAEQATEGLAYSEAVDFYTRARMLLPEGDERRRTLALKRAIAYQALFHAVMDAPEGVRP
ncbi:MAG TPA: AAA family ATPase [Thermoleophilaceae bacterium]|nr:AAA family ATPase [Thermoleophilaceae bacterium]